MTGEWVPVDACTLPTAEQPLRAAEFQALLSRPGTVVEHPSPTAATFHLEPDDGLRDRTRDLVARESGCCSFFAFTVTEQSSGGVDLRVEVPPERADVLAGLVAMVGLFDG